MSNQLIRRIDANTGKAEWHTLHEWNVINGYEEPNDVSEVLEGEVIMPKKSQNQSRTPTHEALRRVFANRVMQSPNHRRRVTKSNQQGTSSNNEETSATMFEPC